MLRINYITGAGLLLLLPSLVQAQRQRSLSVTAAVQLQGTQARFADHQPRSNRVNVTPSLHRSAQIGLIVGRSARQEFQATVGFTAWGFSFTTKQNPSQTRFDGANVASFQQNAFEYAVVWRRKFPAADRPGRNWFAEAGLDVEDISLTAPVSFGFGNVDRSQPTGPGLAGEGYVLNSRRYRPGVRFGAGREWAIWPSGPHYLAMQLVGSFGLRDLQRSRLRTVTWEQSRSIDAQVFTNEVATRFSFVGVQLRYRYQL